MKLNKGIKSNLLTTLFRSYIFQCGIISVIIIVVSNLMGMLLQWLLSKYVPDYYLFYRSLYLGVAAVIVWALCIIFLTYRLLKKVVAYVDELQEATGKLFDSNVDYIELSPELSEIAAKIMR